MLQSPETQECTDSNMPESAGGTPEVQVVGSFDELNGVLTPAQCKQIQSKSGQKVKLVSLQEAAQHAQAENEALLKGMPEDAAMIQGQGYCQQRTKSNKTVENDLSLDD